MPFRTAALRQPERTTCTCRTVRGESLEELGFGEDEVALEGETLDGRSVTGRARVLRLEGSWAALQIEGLGPLVVQGRAL